MTPSARGILICIATYCILIFLMRVFFPIEDMSPVRLGVAVTVIALSSIAAGVWVWHFHRSKRSKQPPKHLDVLEPRDRSHG